LKKSFVSDVVFDNPKQSTLFFNDFSIEASLNLPKNYLFELFKAYCYCRSWVKAKVFGAKDAIYLKDFFLMKKEPYVYETSFYLSFLRSKKTHIKQVQQAFAARGVIRENFDEFCKDFF